MNESSGESSGAGDRHLLTEHCTHGDLIGVNMAGYPKAGALPHDGCEQVVLREDGRYGDRVGVEVEESPALLHCGFCIATVSQLEAALDVAVVRTQAHVGFTVRQ